MLGHYLTVALRNFRRSPVSTGINVLALALGLTCFVIAYAVVQYWAHAEQGFAKAGRTYAVQVHARTKNGGFDTGVVPQTNPLYAKYLALDFPEFETIARVDPAGEIPIAAGDRKAQFFAAYADPEFLDVFDLAFVAGDAKTALRSPEGAVLTEAAAIRLFGTTEAIGRTIRFGDVDLHVTAVAGSIRQPSHIGRTRSALVRFDILLPWDLRERMKGLASENPDPNAPKPPERWFSGYCCVTYVVLSEASRATPESLKARFAAFVTRRVPQTQLATADLTVGLLPVRDLMAAQLGATIFAGANVGLPVTTLLMLFGGLVLIVACVNYANLATAQAIRRAKEVGLRKVIGAGRVQIMLQYVLEAGLLTAAAVVLALAITVAFVPAIRDATEIDLRLVLFKGIGFWLFVSGVIGGVTVMAGAYPALYLSQVRPINALSPAGARSGARLVPTLLVGSQFLAASFLLIAVIVMQQQTGELRRTGLGIDTDPLVVVTNDQSITKLDTSTLQAEFRRLPQVVATTSTFQTPWNSEVNTVSLRRGREEASATYTAFQNGIDYDFFPTMGMTILAGRVFDRDHGDDRPAGNVRTLDPNTPLNIVIDRAYAEQLGFDSPSAAVDQIIYWPMAQQGRPDQPVRIVGVVENKPLHFIGMGTTGNAYRLGANFQEIVVRLSARDVRGGLKAVEEAWSRMVPGQPLNYAFMDSLFAQGYALFGTVSDAFRGLALFAFVISAIGLIGMASHTAARRRHEIGVRKTLGASTRQILVMLLRDFAKPVVVANVVAWPVAYIAVQAYLGVFIHRVSLSPAPFALSLVITLLIAWAAVGGQAIRAARTKPAAVLRYE
jgi:putative ABC transport system permease protein